MGKTIHAIKRLKQDDADLKDLDNFEKIEAVKSGVSKERLVSFKHIIGIDYDSLSFVLGTTKATLHKKQEGERFGPAVSEKIIALMDVFRYGYEVFEENASFNKWVQTPNRALGGEVPLKLMDTFFGMQEVKNLIGRIEHGVYS
ncbi:antitoxin Xre/MbcA/ParS toxin-binding domain-containing protein [Pedobacter sp. SYP-B3415]|uniref:type II RES/Xre toxin-antitoxin system antitoxin n=1 Tax=Pedobacter sp. SYP-B3415 TaxID=2496641 RepID=UPI00101E0F0D|nr:antitoxin Xre/MbcA/ParS toxin-binding domain-containing protein [Pedobacter sp. SYP-B3415]